MSTVVATKYNMSYSSAYTESSALEPVFIVSKNFEFYRKLRVSGLISFQCLTFNNLSTVTKEIKDTRINHKFEKP